MTQDLIHDAYDFLRQHVSQSIVFVRKSLSRFQMATIHFRVHDLDNVSLSIIDARHTYLEGPNGLEKRKTLIFDQLSRLQSFHLSAESSGHACHIGRYLMQPQ
jgi:hypothetical protein